MFILYTKLHSSFFSIVIFTFKFLYLFNLVIISLKYKKKEEHKLSKSLQTSLFPLMYHLFLITSQM